MSNIKLIGSLLVMGFCATGALAQSSAGSSEFVESCASCHGVAGQGNGPLSEYMTVAVPDLTRLAIANDGEFPMLAVIQIIDGRTGVRAHGSQMPVWGARYEMQYTPQTGEYGSELMVRGRILALAMHLESIQE